MRFIACKCTIEPKRSGLLHCDYRVRDMATLLSCAQDLRFDAELLRHIRESLERPTSLEAQMGFSYLAHTLRQSLAKHKLTAAFFRRRTGTRPSEGEGQRRMVFAYNPSAIEDARWVT